MKHGTPARHLLMIAIACGTASAQSTTLVSVDSSGIQAMGYSLDPSISADGRRIAFTSYSNNLVAGDTNVRTDIFVHDQQTGTTQRVSVDSAGAQSNGDSGNSRISGDGRFVAFSSLASNLVPGDTNGVRDVFVHDRQMGTTSRVSVDSSGAQATLDSNTPAISVDGHFVAFSSGANNLVAGDLNGFHDAFIHDRQSGTTEIASVSSTGVQGNGHATNVSIDGSGRRVAFYGFATNLVPGDTNAIPDIFVRDLLTATTVRVSVASDGTQAQGTAPVTDASSDPAFSADGRFVAFVSSTVNLVPGDTNGRRDVFVHEIGTGTTVRASIGYQGAQANGDCFWAPSISAEGRWVGFLGQATNLVYGDTNNQWDVFVRDLWTSTTTRANLPQSGWQSQPPLGDQPRVSLADDGRFVAFSTSADNLVFPDANSTAYDVFVRDRGAGYAFASHCSGGYMGSFDSCPCSNIGAFGHGCSNSSGFGGALLAGSGVASLAADSVELVSSGELSAAFSIVLQGDAVVSPVFFGDSLRCVGGALKRLYTKNASAGSISVPGPGEASISARSAALGDTIQPGARRDYQIYYRDPDASFCPAPQGGTFNTTQALGIVWLP